eukprot:Em0023g465a
MRSVSHVMSSEWVKELKRYLAASTSRQVSVVLANARYEEVVVNWLAAAAHARPPLQDVIVVALDRELHSFLLSKEINVVYLPIVSMIDMSYKFPKSFSSIMMLRLGVMRIINHLGYHVAMYDADAIVLRNPQPLFDAHPDADIISSSGEFPQFLLEQWNVNSTLCIGAVLVKSNERTEQYWETMASIHLMVPWQNTNDQYRLNFALQSLGIRWGVDDDVQVGICQNGLKVAVLPNSLACRGIKNCHPEERAQYYIWHAGFRTEEGKVDGAKRGNAWFLRERWKDVERHLVGYEWLLKIVSWRPR